MEAEERFLAADSRAAHSVAGLEERGLGLGHLPRGIARRDRVELDAHAVHPVAAAIRPPRVREAGVEPHPGIRPGEHVGRGPSGGRAARRLAANQKVRAEEQRYEDGERRAEPEW